MKPHKLKKFKQQVQFRKDHGGLSMLQTYAMVDAAAQELARQMLKDPDKLQKSIDNLKDLLFDGEKE